MSTSLPPEIQQYVEQVVATGRYESAEQVVREAFRLLQEQDRAFASLQTDVKKGFDQLERGEGIELDDQGLREFFDDVQARGKGRYEAANLLPMA
ncbi:MAG: type II toxin-antitoxin system ParD family antitoxin [Candidatus Nealsonbacteria bacterium]|nr:type II toxin-antitoxin system ParD family antitoxin [Candidatus Nealsonbacteria bacterium]